MNFDRFRVRIAGFFVPLLTLAMIRRQFHDRAAGQVKLIVDIEDSLHEVISVGQIREVFEGITGGTRINYDRRARRKMFHI